ncbi:hypothetical protein CRG98_014256 [Punica granatum]|uniref:Uncharacterized protein n=1 Tax=Punica granatum TaxID=22663 RepID=A0A2I0KA31_PUNGR|nr:hypothetical protein CRG98_014256 [Punica granatum]
MQRTSDNTSRDYLEHISRIEKTTSVLTGVPHYPNVHRAFNGGVASEERNGSPRDQPQEKAEMIKQKSESPASAIHGGTGYGEEAYGFTQRRPRIHLSKWKTYK